MSVSSLEYDIAILSDDNPKSCVAAALKRRFSAFYFCSHLDDKLRDEPA